MDHDLNHVVIPLFLLTLYDDHLFLTQDACPVNDVINALLNALLLMNARIVCDLLNTIPMNMYLIALNYVIAEMLLYL